MLLEVQSVTRLLEGQAKQVRQSFKFYVNHCSPCVMLLAAPSAAPTSVSVSEVTSSSITVQWGAVDCIHRNEDITGYSVRYGVQGSGSTQTMSVSGGSVTNILIFGLNSSTNYIVQVAAENLAGTGMYSEPPLIIPIGSK